MRSRTKLTLIGAYDERDGSSPDSDADFGRVNVDPLGRSATGCAPRTAEAALRQQVERPILLAGRPVLQPRDAARRGRDQHHSVRPDPRSPTDSAPRRHLCRLRHRVLAAEHRLGSLGRPALRSRKPPRIGHRAPAIGAPCSATRSSRKPPQVQRVAAASSASRGTGSPELMTYASVARGYRGGGFNAPTAPTRTYKGDSAWTYELGHASSLRPTAACRCRARSSTTTTRTTSA